MMNQKSTKKNIYIYNKKKDTVFYINRIVTNIQINTIKNKKKLFNNNDHLLNQKFL